MKLGVSVPLLGESLQGSVFRVLADNLGAHSVEQEGAVIFIQRPRSYIRFMSDKSKIQVLK